MRVAAAQFRVVEVGSDGPFGREPVPSQPYRLQAAGPGEQLQVGPAETEPGRRLLEREEVRSLHASSSVVGARVGRGGAPPSVVRRWTADKQKEQGQSAVFADRPCGTGPAFWWWGGVVRIARVRALLSMPGRRCGHKRESVNHCDNFREEGGMRRTLTGKPKSVARH